jgi:hypothetical protein
MHSHLFFSMGKQGCSITQGTGANLKQSSSAVGASVMSLLHGLSSVAYQQSSFALTDHS